ncbi:L-aspartate oxidase, partial [Ruegeria sp. NA]|nr:L-aspartate oxidase [Ruegeria sp. NA]
LQTIAQLEAQHDACPSFCNMCATATLIAAAALHREESRGAHKRSDFPKANDGPGERSRMYLSEAMSIRAKACEELS